MSWHKFALASCALTLIGSTTMAMPRIANASGSCKSTTPHEGAGYPGGGYEIDGGTGKASFSIASPSYSPQTFNAYQVISDGTNCGAMFRAEQGGFNGTDFLNVCFTVPGSALNHQVNGLHVGGISRRAATAGLGGDEAVYASMVSAANNGNVLTINSVARDTAGFIGQTLQNEFDFVVSAPDTGVAGLDLIMDSAFPGVRGNAFMTRAFREGRWSSSFFSPGGSADIALFGGATNSGNSQPSQKIQLSATSSSGAGLNAIIQESATGSFDLKPQFDATTGASVLNIENDSSASVSSKNNTLQFLGRDTRTAAKPEASLVVVPADVDHSSDNMVVNVRAGDAVVPSITFVPNGIQLRTTTVSGLGICGSRNSGALKYVTDAVSPSYNRPLAGGGTSKTLALCNGSAWTAH